MLKSADIFSLIYYLKLFSLSIFCFFLSFSRNPVGIGGFHSFDLDHQFNLHQSLYHQCISMQMTFLPGQLNPKGLNMNTIAIHAMMITVTITMRATMTMMKTVIEIHIWFPIIDSKMLKSIQQHK